tara:strand:+ start:7912 stop:9072 length:1161 start_codon:yes stop_codon:yes gene_type:complete
MNIDIVFLLTRSDTVGGVQVHIQDLSERLISDKYNIEVLVGAKSSKNTFIKSLKQRKIPFKILKNLVKEINLIDDIKTLYFLIRYFHRNKIKLVSIHSSKSGILGRIACLITSTPCIFTAHGWSFNSNPLTFQSKIYSFLEFITQLIPRKIITVSNFDRISAIERKIRRSKLITVYNSVPNINFKRSYNEDNNLDGSRKNDIRLINVARFDHQKDQISIMKALASIKTKNKWHLDLIGDGPLLSSCKDLAIRLGINNSVTFHGFVSDTEKFYNLADIFVLMSHWEGFPRSSVEALRSELPILVSNVGGSSEAVIDNHNGFVIPHRDSKYLSECLTKLIDDKNLRISMSKISKKIFVEKFSYEIFYQKMLSIYNQFILASNNSYTNL